MLPLPVLLILVFGVLISAAFFMAWPQSKSCLSTLVRLLAFLIGAVAPLAVLWQMQGGLLSSLFNQFSLTSLASWGLIVAVVLGGGIALILGASAVTLAALGWQMVLQQRRSKEIEKQVDLSIFDPFKMISSTGSHSSSSGSDDLAGCFLGLLMALFGGLFWFGIQLGQGIAKQGLPASTPKNPQRAGRAALSFIYTLVIYFCLIGLFFGVQAVLPASALKANTSTPAETEVSYMPASSVTLEEAPHHLDALWKQLDQGGKIMWDPAYSPLFPSEWPPTPGTVWTRYAFAYGRDFTLIDAQRVSHFWARLEFHPTPTGHTASIVPMQNKLEAWEVQGVQPLEATESDVLGKEALVSDYCLRLTSLPDPQSSETTRMRDYYRAWLKYNGAIAREIIPRYPGFIAWVGQ